MLTARAASITRRTSSRVTVRSFDDTAMTPRLLNERMCPPAMPTVTVSMLVPAIVSASATAAFTASTVASRLTTTPLRRPREGASPTPTIRVSPPAIGSATTQQIFVVPMSRPTT